MILPPPFYVVVVHYPALGTEQTESRHESLSAARTAARAFSAQHPHLQVSVREVRIRMRQGGN